MYYHDTRDLPTISPLSHMRRRCSIGHDRGNQHHVQSLRLGTIQASTYRPRTRQRPTAAHIRQWRARRWRHLSINRIRPLIPPPPVYPTPTPIAPAFPPPAHPSPLPPVEKKSLLDYRKKFTILTPGVK